MEKNYDSRLNKYRSLGLLITRNLRKDSHVEQCPPIEDIAALADGKLEGKEKEKVVSHITECQLCYEVFSETMKTILSLSKSKKEKITWYSVPPLALAACLILIVRIVFFAPVTDLPYSHEMVDQLAYVLEPDDLQSGLVVRGQGFSGLAESLGLLTVQQQLAFRMGFHIAGLELATVDENSEQSQKQLAELKKILNLTKQSALSGSLKDVEAFLNTNKFLEASEQIRLIQNKITSDVEEGKITSFYHLGLWCSIGQVVFKSENEEAIKLFLVNRESVKSLKILLEKEGAPETTLESLQKITAITEGKNLGKSEYQEISTHIQKIVDYFLI